MRTEVAHRLLLADIALARELASVEHLAAALERGLAAIAEQRELDLVGDLVSEGAIDETDAATLRQAADAEGDPQAALDARGSAGRMALLLPDAGPRLRLVLGEWGVDARASLRDMPAGRYVDYVPVGKGGMGIVYLARDVELNREVALKVIHLAGPGAAGDVTPIDPSGLRWPPESDGDSAVSNQIEARFLQEAWITGSMSHPGIVPVYELGQTEVGVPYYTMRFIEGRRTLADAIAEVRDEPFERRLPLLDAFLDVCDTIRYAHSRGVLHRDLKPSNVVLGEYGEVVVVDWGLARVQDRPDRTVDLFRRRVEAFRAASELQTMVSALGTPGYMAPEAAGGDVEGVTTQSDVYSLSVVLFEILTGTLPIPVTSIREYLVSVRAGDVAEAQAVSPEVPGPLARLCARGLQLDPQERLGSVEELAREIRRWREEAAEDREVDALTREAEAALSAARDASGPAVLPHLELASHASRRIQSLRPDSKEAGRLLDAIDGVREAHVAALERAARRTLARRVGVAAVILAALVAVGVSFVLEQRRQEAADARAAAAASRDRAERVMTFMVEDLQNDLAPLGRLDLLAKIGTRARAYYEDQSLEGGSLEGLGNRATAMRRLGDAFRLRGDLPQALSAYAAAGAAGSLLDERGGAEIEGAFQAALAGARAGEVLVQQGLTTKGRDVLLRHQAELTRLAGLRPTNTELLTAQSDVAARLVSVLFAEGRPDEGLRLAQKALDLAERAAQSATDLDANVRRLVLRRRLLLASMRYGPGSDQRATRIRELLEDIRTELRQAPGDVRWQTLEVAARRQVARAHSDRGEYDAAEKELSPAVAALQELVNKDATNLAWASTLAMALRQHGDAFISLGRPVEARPLYEASFDRMRLLSSADPTNAAWLNQLITLCDRRVLVTSRTESSEADIERWRAEAVRYARRLLERDAENARHRHIIAYTMHTYAVQLSASSKPDEALKLSGESQAILADLLADNPDNMEAAVLLGWNASMRCGLLVKQGPWRRAVAAAAEPLEVLGSILKHRPDYWMVRVQQVQLLKFRFEQLLKGSAEDVAESSRARKEAEASLSAGLALESISALARQRLEELRESVREKAK